MIRSTCAMPVLAALTFALLVLAPVFAVRAVGTAAPTQAVALGKDDQIKHLAKAGKLTFKMTKTVLNCPIIEVLGKGS